ncbi:hypothetical protein JCM9279_002763 [Rhodotorula babjevae]
MAHASTTLAEDAAVRSTDTDALVSRCCAASLGYLDDNLSPAFLSPNQRRNLDRRPPLINLGTHARTWAVDRLVADFLLVAQVGHQCQVVSLGAGTDSRFWRMRNLFDHQGRDWPCKHWVEVDFPEATSAKARAVASKPALRDALGDSVKIEHGGQGLSSSLYSLLPGDIRSLDALTSSLVPSLSASAASSSSSSTPTGPPAPTRPAPLSPSLPTLLLLECVLVYVPPAAADALLAWFARTWGAPRQDAGEAGQAPGGAVVLYDPFGLDDKFGEVMRRNLAARGLSLPGAPATPTHKSLEERLVRAGARGEVGSRTVRAIRERCLPREELERVNAIERIDEVEELNLVLEHYAVSWANLLPSDEGSAAREGEGGAGGGGGRGIGLRDAVDEEGS